MKNSIKTDIIICIIISFIGYWFEDVWMLIRYGILDNRNMYLPFLLGYGLLVVCIYYIFGTPKKIFNRYQVNGLKKYIIYFLIAMIVVSIGELALGICVEKILGYSYWDYTSIPLHITKYTSVPTSIGFALVITLFMNFVYEPLRNKISNKVDKIPMFILILLLVILIVDFILSFRNMYINNGRNMVWIFNLR